MRVKSRQITARQIATTRNLPLAEAWSTKQPIYSHGLTKSTARSYRGEFGTCVALGGVASDAIRRPEMHRPMRRDIVVAHGSTMVGTRCVRVRAGLVATNIWGPLSLLLFREFMVES